MPTSIALLQLGWMLGTVPNTVHIFLGMLRQITRILCVWSQSKAWWCFRRLNISYYDIPFFSQPGVSSQQKQAHKAFRRYDWVAKNRRNTSACAWDTLGKKWEACQRALDEIECLIGWFLVWSLRCLVRLMHRLKEAATQFDRQADTLAFAENLWS